MYTYCTIQFIDDNTTQDVIIKANEDFDIADEEIFFYGMTREELLTACENGDICEGEWRVIAVAETLDEIY